MVSFRNGFTVFVLLILTASPLSAQSGTQNIFDDVKKLIDDARDEGADLLSPQFFEEAVESFEEANEYYRENKSARDIREKLIDARDYAQKARSVVQAAKVALKDALTARDNAIKVDASKYAQDAFEVGEDLLYDAARQMEKNDLEDARDISADAEEYYRQAELKAIKDIILGEARNAIDEAREADADEFSPQTFNYAVNLMEETDNLLTNDRYAGDEAQKKADECAYQARHAAYLAKSIQILWEDDKNWEKTLLKFEDILTGFGAKFNERMMFDRGFDEPVDFIMQSIGDMQNDNQRLIEENARLQEDYNVAREKATTTTAELARKQELESKIEKIKMSFKINEAKVYYDGENLVVRLHGLNFQPGRAIIMPEYFSLLTKVQDALREFPDSHVELQGHTDSKGVPSKNLRLSEERAAAVREYIIANMGIDRQQISAVGYGDTRPVASNNSVEGRALNRRIDVVIRLEE